MRNHGHVRCLSGSLHLQDRPSWMAVCRRILQSVGWSKFNLDLDAVSVLMTGTNGCGSDPQVVSCAALQLTFSWRSLA